MLISVFEVLKDLKKLSGRTRISGRCHQGDFDKQLLIGCKQYDTVLPFHQHCPVKSWQLQVSDSCIFRVYRDICITLVQGYRTDGLLLIHDGIITFIGQ